MKVEPTCPNCGKRNVFIHTGGISGVPSLNYLPGLGGFLCFAKLYPAVCQDCGLVRFFTDQGAVSNLESSDQWKRLDAEKPANDVPKWGG